MALHPDFPTSPCEALLPDNGHEGQSWRDDFQITLHIQDDVRVARDTGNIFLTNIHRAYLRDVREPRATVEARS